MSSYLGFNTVPATVSTDNATGDAFGRFRVANPVTVFDSQLQYDKQPDVWLEKVVGTASSTHLPNESSVELSVGTASGDRIGVGSHSGDLQPDHRGRHMGCRRR